MIAYSFSIFPKIEIFVSWLVVFYYCHIRCVYNFTTHIDDVYEKNRQRLFIRKKSMIGVN